MIGELQGEFEDLDINYLKQKNLKKCRLQISGSFRRISQPCKLAVKFRSIKDTISQPKADFTTLRNWPLAWSDRLPMAVTPSFQLWIIHRLKSWIANFPSFETTYSMHNLSSRKCSKSGWQLLSSWILHGRFLFADSCCPLKYFMVDFSLLPLLAFMICLWQMDFKALKLWFFIFLSFPLLCHGFQRTLLNLELLWWSNY